MTSKKVAHLKADLTQLHSTITRLGAKAEAEYLAAPEGQRDGVLAGISIAHGSTAEAIAYLIEKEY